MEIRYNARMTSLLRYTHAGTEDKEKSASLYVIFNLQIRPFFYQYDV